MAENISNGEERYSSASYARNPFRDFFRSLFGIRGRRGERADKFFSATQWKANRGRLRK